MSAELLNQLLPPLIFSVFSIGFIIVWFYQRNFPSALVFSLSYGIGAFAFAVEALVSSDNTWVITRYLGDIGYTLSAMLFAFAMSLKFTDRIKWKMIGLISLIVILGHTWFRFVEPSISMRIQIISLGSAVLMFLSAFHVLQHLSGKSEKLLSCLIFALSIGLLTNTVLSFYLGFAVTSEADIANSIYLAAVNLIVSVGAPAIAVTLFLLYGMEIISQLKNQSQTDALSGLLNRRGFENACRMVLTERVSGSNKDNTLIMCDLDHFKKVNDIYGHAVGDLVIETFANLLKVGCRQSDYVGRVGGEEFAIFMPGANCKTAKALAEALRVKFAETPIEGIPGRRPVTASFGVAEAKPGETYQELYKRADDALYEAKQGGRDRVMGARDIPRETFSTKASHAMPS